jgi:hypothetical protein
MQQVSSLLAPSPAPRHTVDATYRNPRSWAYQFRKKRFARIEAMVAKIIAQKGSCRIADLGGTAYYWDIAGPALRELPVEIHLINLSACETPSDQFISRVGNVCDLADLDDRSFDLVHSNSVIEHVGNWENCRKMAANVSRLAPAYYVQTPNFWFPYEPHFRFPGFQFLPEQVRFRLLMTFNLGFGGRRESVDAAMEAVQSAALLDARQMRALFPDAELAREWFGPFTKSLMMIREG